MTEVCLLDIIEVIGGGTPKRKCPEYWGGDIDWLSVKDFNFDERYVHHAQEKITKEGLENSSTKLLSKGDIIISARGTIGCLGQLTKSMAFNQSCYGIRGKEKIQNDFLYYLLKTKISELQKNSHGAVFDTITTDTFKTILVHLPSLTEQKSISSILGALDDKIENNRRMNKTLEEMAQAIFKSWFVDFDPVHAKAAGNQPAHMDADTAALFPNIFGNDGFPVGWNVHSLGDFTTLVKGKSYKSIELQNSNIALVTLKSFLRGGGYRHDGLKEYTGVFKPEQVVSEGDLIIALTDVTQAADVIGKPAIVRNSSEHDTLVASLDVGIVKFSKQELITKEFCYFLMLTDRYTAHSLGYTSGTTVLHLAKDTVSKFEFCLPKKPLVQKFSEIASSLQKKIFMNEKESEALSNLRDILLLKLMSGEVRVKDTKKIIKEIL